MGVLDRLRDLKEKVEEKVVDPVYRAREKRVESVQREATRDFRERTHATQGKAQRGEISQTLAQKRMGRLKERYEREKIPLEDRVAQRAVEVGSKVAHGSAQLIQQAAKMQGRSRSRSSPRQKLTKAQRKSIRRSAKSQPVWGYTPGISIAPRGGMGFSLMPQGLNRKPKKRLSFDTSDW